MAKPERKDALKEAAESARWALQRVLDPDDYIEPHEIRDVIRRLNDALRRLNLEEG